MQFTNLNNSINYMIRKFQLRSVSHNISDRRCFTDTPKKSDSESKQLVMVKSTALKQSLITRRVRPTDIPRVLNFMREHARSTWPGKAAPPLSSQTMLNDYISRILAQGHSMLTEQLEMPHGWTRIRGLALATVYTQWDPKILESFSRCIKSPLAKRLIEFSAYCLRAPALHEKYRVHNVLQVILIVPEQQDSVKIANALINNTIKRGRDVGFPLVRFDANCDTIVKTLEDMKFIKEWHMQFKIYPSKIIEHKERTYHVLHVDKTSSKIKPEKPKKASGETSFVTVFTSLLNKIDT